MSKEKNTVRALLDIPVGEPETMTVLVQRHQLKIKLRELPYNKLVSLRGTEDADLNYLLASAVEPDFRDRAWYKEKMGCPTPVDALKKLLRGGEVRAIVRQCDRLNGYGAGAVVVLEEDEQTLQNAAVEGALEDLEKN